ncbi:recombinase family protein [Streptomyces sp. NPDC001876]|uniref:recombinase family protein n=1 Tax=Streptomyces sp. NPDC001876 TaxID=3154402 RepID=UPI0033329ED5
MLTDETTSPERQRDANHSAAAALNIDLADREAVDLGVSASKTTPFERPELGEWLQRPDDYDALVFWRFDRAVRSMDDMHELSKWARDNRKMIVFAEGPGGRLVLDFRDALNPMAQLMVTLFAFAAQMEAQSIRERVLGAQSAMRTMPLRWRGSKPPYGYAPADLEDGGKTLVQDKKAVKVIERIIKELMNGKTLSAICAELNDAGIESPRDHWSLIKGREKGGKAGNGAGLKVTKERFKWRHGALKRLLTSEALLGWKTTDAGPVRDSEGVPVMATREPILTREEFDAVGAMITDANPDGTKWKFRVDSVAMLLRVIFCDGCGQHMFLGRPSATSKQISDVYKCGSWGRGEKCPEPSSVKREWAEEYVREHFLAAVGGLRMTETRHVPGYDPQPEIDATTAEYEAHMSEQGQQTSKAAQGAWKRRATALDARLAELETREARPARTEVIQLGTTIADAWRDADDTSRRDMLQEAGVTVRIKRAKRGRVFKLNEERVIWRMGNDFFSEGADELAAIADTENEMRRAEEQLRPTLDARRGADVLALSVQQLVSDTAATQAGATPEPGEAVAARHEALMSDHDEADRKAIEARADNLRRQ